MCLNRGTKNAKEQNRTVTFNCLIVLRKIWINDRLIFIYQPTSIKNSQSLGVKERKGRSTKGCENGKKELTDQFRPLVKRWRSQRTVFVKIMSDHSAWSALVLVSNMTNERLHKAWRNIYERSIRREGEWSKDMAKEKPSFEVFVDDFSLVSKVSRASQYRNVRLYEDK